MPFCWNLSRVSLMVGLGLLVWDRKITEKVTFRPMSQRVHTCSVLYHRGRWPWSPGRSGVRQVSSLWSYSFTLLFTLSSFQNSPCSCCCSVTKSCLTLLQPHRLHPARLLCPWDFPDNNTGVGYHFLFQGIFLTQRSNLHLLNSWPLSHQGSPVLFIAHA